MHTQGKWEFQEHDSQSGYLGNIRSRWQDSEGRNYQRSISCVTPYAGYKEGRANAQLMAAAPDMLEALEEVMPFICERSVTPNCSHQPGECDTLCMEEAQDAELLLKVRKAIAKAKIAPSVQISRRIFVIVVDAGNQQ